MILATTVYSDNEDTEAATVIVRAIISASRSRPTSTNEGTASSSQSNNQQQSSQVQSNDNVSSKIAHNVAMRFRTEKFTGDIGESWNEHVAEYQQVAMDYNPGNQQKLQYLHNIMGGDAKRFYQNNVQPHVNTYAHAVEMIKCIGL